MNKILRHWVDSRSEFPVSSCVKFHFTLYSRTLLYHVYFFADTTTWRSAVVLAVQEIRRLGLFGLTPSEVRFFVFFIVIFFSGEFCSCEEVLGKLTKQ